jgi:hypothetical protein
MNVHRADMAVLWLALPRCNISFQKLTRLTRTLNRAP